MGTGGNQRGYKVFSINTTVRNPKRNRELLLILKDFDGALLDSNQKHIIFDKLIKLGWYKFENSNTRIQLKYQNGEELSDSEIEHLKKK